MNTELLSEDESLKYPMLYKFPELGDHWGEDVKESTFVTLDTYDKAYERIEECENNRKKISGNHQCFDVCWISVDEMLPNFDELVLCCLKSKSDSIPRYQFMSHHDGDKGWHWRDQNGQGDEYPVTHWIPLPTAPKKYSYLKPEVW